MKKYFVVLCVFSHVVFAQDELSTEIDKLEQGEVEELSPSSSTSDALDAVEQDIENELLQEPSAPQTEEVQVDEDLNLEEVPESEEEIAQPNFEEAPDTLPEELTQEATPVVEEQPAPEVAPVQPVEESLSQPVESFASNQNGGDFESRLNRIYNQFYTEAISDDSWKQIAGEKINEVYVVQSGDTLWDISVTFFGNGHYWPKVWQLNDDITNPHLISSGYQLKFVPGTLNQAPQLNISQEEGGQTEQDVASSQTETPLEEVAPVIPPPSKRSRSVLQNLPPSLPMLVSKQYSEYDPDGFSKQQSKVIVKNSDIYLTSFITSQKPEKLGRVAETNIMGIDAAGIYDTIYVELEDGVSVNDRFLVYSLGDKIKAPESRRSGYQVFCFAEIRIQDKVNPDKNIYKAIVTKSIFPLKTGALLTRGAIPVASVDETGSSGSAAGEIIGGDYEEERFHFGQQQVVYLDRGADDGVQTGSIFSVRKNHKLRNSHTLVREMKEQIAKIKVVKTDSKFATAVVLNSREDVRVGDKFTAAVGGAAPILVDPLPGGTSENIPDIDSEEVERDEFIEE